MYPSQPRYYNPIPVTQNKEVFQDNPDLSYLKHLNYSDAKYRDAIHAEIKARWIELNKGKSPAPSRMKAAIARSPNK